MVPDGFKKEVSYVNKTMSQGEFELGQVLLPDVTPAGSTVVLALAVWNTAASSWAAMLSSANTNAAAGVLAFVNPTVAPTSGPPPVLASLPGWSSSVGDLVMTALYANIPEPSTLSLVGLGAAALLLFRQRK